MSEVKAKKRHYHILRRHSYKNGERIYFCTDNCSFKVNVKLCLGKEVLCNVCLKLFKMNEYSIRLAKPRCMECINKKNTVDAVAQVGLKHKREVNFDDLNLELPSSILNEEIKAPVINNPISDLKKRLRDASFAPAKSLAKTEATYQDSDNSEAETNSDDLL